MGVGGTFNLGSPWSDATVSSPAYVKLILAPPVIPGVQSALFEVVCATVVNGSALATVVQRNAESGGSLQTHLRGTVWICGATAQDFTSDLGPIAESQVAGLTSDLASKAAAADLTAETSRATAAEALALQKSANLSDLASASAARTALGLGSAATQASSAFDAAGTSAAETTRAQNAEALLAPLASPALTGNPTAPTQSPLTNNTRLATTAYADAAVAVETSRAQTAEASKMAILNAGLIGWALAEAFVITSATRDANEAITTASVVWPDGSTGTFTTDAASTAFPGAIDAYHVTYVPASGPTKTVTQTAVTRDAAGAVTAQPALTVA